MITVAKLAEVLGPQVRTCPYLYFLVNQARQIEASGGGSEAIELGVLRTLAHLSQQLEQTRTDLARVLARQAPAPIVRERAGP